jgi:mRNA interferase MazF
MKRGELYRVRHPEGDPKHFRVFVIVSRQSVIDSKFSTVVCAPILSGGEGLATQVPVGVDEGLKHCSWIICDGLASVRKSQLSQFVGTLSPLKVAELNRALAIAVDLG